MNDTPLAPSLQVSCADDGRPALEALYASYQLLAEEGQYKRGIVFGQELGAGQSEQEPLAILSWRTGTPGRALWVLAGIHGEEPAGPVAVAEQIHLLLELARRGIPCVLLPLCNPKGYHRGWRYPDRRRGPGGHSVGDCEHLLPDPQNPGQPRRAGGAASPEAGALAAHALQLARSYAPLLVVDLHEDEQSPTSGQGGCGYVYSQGARGAADPIAREIVRILEGAGFVIPREGYTRFGEAIVDGVVACTSDGSIDEMLASPTLIRDGRPVRGPWAHSVIVVETPVRGVSLAKRVAAHVEILRALPHLWEMAQAGNEVPGGPTGGQA